MILDAIIILLIIIGLVYYIKKGKDPKKKKKRSPIGCLVMIVLFIIVGVFGARMMGNMYDEAEKKGNKISFDKAISRINSLKIISDLNLSDTQKKTIAVKAFLIKNCKGGDETLKKLIEYEQNILYDACIIVQNNNFIDKFTESIDNVKSFHMQVLKADFKGAVKLYDWYINE